MSDEVKRVQRFKIGKKVINISGKNKFFNIAVIIFLAGIFAGIIMMNIWESTLLSETGLLDEYTLYRIKYMTVDSSGLFYYVTRKRICSAFIILVLSTTYLGIAVCGLFVLWYGLTAGVFFSALFMRYGFKGLILAVISIFPQHLLYIPAFGSLVVLCMGLNYNIYFKKYSYGGVEGGKRYILDKILAFLAIFIVIFAGCFLESHVNPYILSWFLKFF